MTQALASDETAARALRLNRVLGWLGITPSVWYARRKADPKKPGRKPRPVPGEITEPIRALAEAFPWWGYKRIAVVARRRGVGVSNKQVAAAGWTW